jgi:hypothetical protein
MRYYLPGAKPVSFEQGQACVSKNVVLIVAANDDDYCLSKVDVHVKDQARYITPGYVLSFGYPLGYRWPGLHLFHGSATLCFLTYPRICWICVQFLVQQDHLWQSQGGLDVFGLKTVGAFSDTQLDGHASSMYVLLWTSGFYVCQDALKSKRAEERNS